jgi:hypothetical protein
VPPGARGHIRYDFAVLRVVLFFAAVFPGCFLVPGCGSARRFLRRCFRGLWLRFRLYRWRIALTFRRWRRSAFDIAIKQFDITRHANFCVEPDSFLQMRAGKLLGFNILIKAHGVPHGLNNLALT